MTRTFIDAGVLIGAAVGQPDVSLAARAVLDDPSRVYITSDIVRLEVLPKAVYYGHKREAAFYAAFFDAVAEWVPDTLVLTDRMYQAARTFGLSTRYALHVAAAEVGDCEELVTTEKPGKPLHRLTTLPIVSLYPPDA